MPVTLAHNVYASASRSAAHVLHIIFLRLKHANLSLLVVFTSALFVFLRALVGAGYGEPRYYAPDSEPSTVALNHSYPATDASANGLAHPGFAEHWARFKETLLACPVDASDYVDVDESVADGGDAKSRTRTQVGVGCLKERLSSAISLGRPSGPSVQKEDRAFGVSLDTFPSRRDADAMQKRSWAARP